MKQRTSILSILVVAGLAGLFVPLVSAEHSRPNIVIIFTDDQGYSDLSCFGGEHVSTPRIDQMAAEGLKLTSFYVAAPLCTPSRAALMTGSYPRRIDMANGSDFAVLLAADKKGMNPDEITIAEVLKSAGYRTGMFGKWHLGDQPEFLPTRQGFDEYFGIPYETLDVYQVAIAAAEALHSSEAVSSLSVPVFRRLDELLTSMVLNIAEGNGRFSDANQARFLGTSHESAIKFAARLDLCVVQCLLPQNEVGELKVLLERVSVMTSAMIRSVQK